MPVNDEQYCLLTNAMIITLLKTVYNALQQK
jgi:hypothetical protein